MAVISNYIWMKTERMGFYAGTSDHDPKRKTVSLIPWHPGDPVVGSSVPAAGT